MKVLIPIELVERMGEIVEQMDVDETFETWECVLDEHTTLEIRRDR